MHDFKIASGRSNKLLADKVANHLGLELSETLVRNFSDGEIWVKFNDNVRGVDLFIIQSTFAPADNILELLMLIDAAKRASAKRVTAVIPYFGYARQDRKDQPRVALTAKLIANLLERAGADRIITIDLHSSQIQGFFDIPMDHLYASPVLIRQLKKMGLDNVTFAAPDVGGAKTARSYAKRFGGDLVLVDKRRPQHNVAEIMHIIGDVKDKNVVIVDDMIDTGTTFVNCAEALKDKGALHIIGVCVHPVLSGNALDKIDASDAVSKVFVTDTIPLKRHSDKIEIVSVAELLAEAIIRTHDNRSISSLFEIER
ncbi:MAG TPA: ribose-phosphate pyrophosphokinase [Candidatus Kapabacteria bacterium]|jgi:ribose-phosphate pyrophosphokinase|nr:ribose-phosphate pyrophosphokinase [Candidatus Kapabacteria bacterium]HOM05851.1 ribose-phosphate pyrophosphokinase [Candidatus Kapabacteria bacterium]HOQ49301.1 ribose-phosphate pyrophosphokinase [Candidatus Kapabacteria bacterium]HPP38863.1 ribose-phosphate pyrophosphokinase [Candidatus Kapabacteria bacterium]HPU23323.1 ribose-phosphate pyrophosphokinase [Candidatus Kapabacteria bacterium]